MLFFVRFSLLTLFEKREQPLTVLPERTGEGHYRDPAPIHPTVCCPHSMSHPNPSKGPVWSGLTPFQYANMDGKVPLDSSDSDHRYPSSLAPFDELIHASDMIKQEYGRTSDELRAAPLDPMTQHRPASSPSLPQLKHHTSSSTPPRSSRYDPVRDVGHSASGYTTPSGYAYHYPVHQEQQMAKMTHEDPSQSSFRHSIDFPVRPVAGGSPRLPSAARRNRAASNARPKAGQQQQQSADERAQAEWEQAKANHLAKMRYEQEQAALAWSRNQRMLQQLDVKEEHLLVEGTLIDLWELALLVEEFRGLNEVSDIAPFLLLYRQRAH